MLKMKITLNWFFLKQTLDWFFVNIYLSFLSEKENESNTNFYFAKSDLQNATGIDSTPAHKK